MIFGPDKFRVHLKIKNSLTRENRSPSGVLTALTTRLIDIGCEDSGPTKIYFIELLWLTIYIDTFVQDRKLIVPQPKQPATKLPKNVVHLRRVK